MSKARDLADGTFDTDTLVVDAANNRVGVGNVSPQKTLDVRGELAISNGTSSYWNINRDDSDGSLTFTDTDTSERLRILTGGGITFNGDTAAANALDDYEEGSWTPSVVTGTVTAVSNAGYIKIGNKVTVWGYIYSFSNRTSTEFVKIILPFSANTTYDTNAVGSAMVRYTNNLVSVVYINSSSQLQFYGPSSTAFDTLAHNDLNSSLSEILFTATYFTA